MTSDLEHFPAETARGMNLAGYLVAIFAVAIAALASWGAHILLLPEIVGVVAVALFAAGVLITAWIGGTGPGLAATALGAIALAVLLSGPGHIFAPLVPRDTAVIVASTALSALITLVVDRLHGSRTALARGLPAIERRARDRANEAAGRRIDEERRATLQARSDLEDMQQKLRQRDASALSAAAARAGYLSAARRAVRLSLRALEHYATRLELAGDTLTPRQHRHLEGVHRCEEHLATVADTLLSPARVESGRLVPEITDVSLSNVMAQCSALLGPYLEAHGSSLECATAAVPHVRADATILTEVLVQLVFEEARRAPGSTLVLEAHESDDGLSLECRTTANESLPLAERAIESPVGADMEEVETLVSSSRSPADLVRQMGGALTTGSAPGAGPRFTIWLPTRAAVDARDAAAPVTVWPPIAFELPRAASRL